MTTYACDCGGTLAVRAPGEKEGRPDFERAYYQCEKCRRRFTAAEMNTRRQRAMKAFADVLRGVAE